MISATAASRASCRTSAMEMEAPRQARSWAVARAMPEAAPVTAMTLPSGEVMIKRWTAITRPARVVKQGRF